MGNVKVEIITRNSGKENYFLTLSEASKISGYTPEHLNLLCRKGVLKGKKIGRNWNTTREWINEFLFLPKIDHKKKYKRRKNGNIIVQRPSGFPLVSTQKKPELFSAPVGFGNGLNFQNFKGQVRKSEIASEPKVETKKISWPKVFFKFSMAIFISFFIFFSVSFYQYSHNKKYLSEINIPENILEDAFIFDGTSGKVEGEESIKGEETQAQAASIATSENFKLREISFGGVLVASANGENLPPEISEVKSEIFMTRDGKQAQILISWKTNKLATSEIEYSKSDVKEAKILEEKNYGFNHSVVLSKLDLGTTYVYTIKARDRWGNEISSERFGIYSGSKMVSVFDLIIKAVDETFSWAIKK